MATRGEIKVYYKDINAEGFITFYVERRMAHLVPESITCVVCGAPASALVERNWYKRQIVYSSELQMKTRKPVCGPECAWKAHRLAKRDGVEKTSEWTKAR